MKVDRDRFIEDGYLIVPGAVPPDRLHKVRNAYEIMVERQKRVWAQQREPDEPPGGEWEMSAQPRLAIQSMVDQIDEQTAWTIQVWLCENIRGVSAELLNEPDAGVTEMMLMCNPVRDRGPAHWHRDMYPPHSAPLRGYIDDIVESGPRYVQWNIALHDDDVLCVMPGSHRRPNTRAEDEQIKKDAHQPLPGGVQTHLKAGDGVVYILPILHWASNYSTRRRRTVHGGYSRFTQQPDLCFLEHLTPEARDAFEHWDKQCQTMKGQTEAALRAAMNKDESAYRAALDRLHPGRRESGRRLSTVYFSKSAQRINDLKRSDFDSLPPRRRQDAVSPHPITLQWGAPFAEHFSRDEAARLWEAFKPIDALLQSESPQHADSFQGGASPYHFVDMPGPNRVDGFLSGA